MPQAECRRVVLWSSIQAATLARAAAPVMKCSAQPGIQRLPAVPHLGAVSSRAARRRESGHCAAVAATGRAGFRDVAEHAALVLSCATDPARPRRELDQPVAGLHHAAANLAGLARQYREAADLTSELDVS